MMSPVPEILYLYLAAPSEKANTVDLLEHCRFKLSRVGNLNDPFDMIPALKENNPPDEVRKYVQAMQVRFGKYGAVTPKRIADVKAKLDRLGRDPYGEWPKLSKRLRLLCLSSRHDGVLLWSHYASNHLGFAVGFRTSVLTKAKLPSSFFEVEYKPERISMGPLDLINHEPSWKTLQTLYSRKSPEWKYEDEWRAMHDRKNLDEAIYLPFDAAAVDCIILGSRLEQETENALRNACIVGGIREDIPLLRSELSRERFEIVNKPTKWREVPTS